MDTYPPKIKNNNNRNKKLNKPSNNTQLIHP